eukprot:RCo035458
MKSPRAHISPLGDSEKFPCSPAAMGAGCSSRRAVLCPYSGPSSQTALVGAGPGKAYILPLRAFSDYDLPATAPPPSAELIRASAERSGSTDSHSPSKPPHFPRFSQDSVGPELSSCTEPCCSGSAPAPLWREEDPD